MKIINFFVIIILINCLFCSSVLALTTENNITENNITENIIYFNFASGNLFDYNLLYPLECEIMVDNVIKSFQYVITVDDCPYWSGNYHAMKDIVLDKSYDHFDNIWIKFKLERQYDGFLKAVIDTFWINATEYIKSTKNNENIFDFKIKMDWILTKADSFTMFDKNNKELIYFHSYY